MLKTTGESFNVLWSLFAVALLALSGCSKPPPNDAPTNTPPKPSEAASQLQQAFVNAQVEVKNTAEAASEALRTANYEKALESLQQIKTRPNLTFEQGMAIYNSERTLEARLIA